MKYKIILTIVLAVFGSSLVAIPGGLTEGKNQELQKAKELEDAERVLDKKIEKINKQLARFYKLINLEINLTPGKTKFIQGDGYIQIESYDFIPVGYSNKSAGQRIKSVKLFFTDKKLDKVETTMSEQNFLERTKYESRVVDPSPDTEGTEDIAIRSKFNLEDTYDVTLQNMENTITNPLKINFKRDYYIPHLEHFEKLFRFTEEYQKRYGTSNDVATIDVLKKTLDY